jgi:hypothetical protein
MLNSVSMLTNYDYYCPCCDNKLTDASQINFLVRTSRGDQAKVQLSVLPGEYGYNSDVDLEIKDGEHVEFNCQSCKANLQSKNYPDFIEIHLKVTKGVVFEVLFSPICGERITYIIMEYEMVRYRDDFYCIMSMNKETA